MCVCVCACARALARRKKIFSAGDDVIKRSLEIVAARLEDSTS